MILTQIKECFQEQPAASLKELCDRFGIAPEAMRGMLDHWIRKGLLRKLPAGRKCPGCSVGCDPTTLEIYEWAGTADD